MNTASDPMGGVRAAHRNAVIIAGAIFAAVACMAIIVELISRGVIGLDDPAAGDPAIIRYVFFAISILLVFAINIIRGLMLRASPVGDIEAVTSRLTAVSVVASGLAETPAIMGFVLYLGWRQYSEFYVLLLISLYLMGRHFPRYSVWESFARERVTSFGG